MRQNFSQIVFFREMMEETGSNKTAGHQSHNHITRLAQVLDTATPWRGSGACLLAASAAIGGSVGGGGWGYFRSSTQGERGAASVQDKEGTTRVGWHARCW